MSLLDLLQSVGGRLGILEAPKPSAGHAGKVLTRTVTLSELKSEIRSEEVRALADLPAELALPFDKIFAAAGIGASGHGWSVARVQDLLRTDSFRALEREAAQRALLERLRAENVDAEDLVREAVAKDQALDSFETFVHRKVEEWRALAERRIAEADAGIQALQSERARLTERLQLEQEKLRDWRQHKRDFERELASAIRYVTDLPVISTDDEKGRE